MIDVAFVTGSSGKIGNELVAHLLEKNILVVGIGRFSENSTIAIKIFENNESISNINESIVYNDWAVFEENNIVNLLQLGKDTNIQSYFFHLAWGGKNALTDGGYETQIYNVGLAAKYLELSKKLNVVKFINSGSSDEIYVERCLESKKFNKIENFQHLEYGIAKLATRDILSFKSYVEKIDFIHTQTSIAVSNTLKNNNFIEKNLNNILTGKKFEIPNNPELCNISTSKRIAKKIYNIALNGHNQKTYYTGTNAAYSLENYFKIIEKLINGEPVKSKTDEIISSQVLNNDDFKNTEHIYDEGLCDPIEDINNLINSLEVL